MVSVSIMVNMISKETLAEALKQYRFEREWTLEQMAIATGLHLTTIQRLEKAKRNAHELTIAILVKRLPGLLSDSAPVSSNRSAL
jgi:DNA-binding XRE family transcriptional regulator